MSEEKWLIDIFIYLVSWKKQIKKMDILLQ